MKSKYQSVPCHFLFQFYIRPQLSANLLPTRVIRAVCATPTVMLIVEPTIPAQASLTQTDAEGHRIVFHRESVAIHRLLIPGT